MIVFKGQLFVGWDYPANIDIYNLTTTLTFHRRLSISGIRCIADLATCPRGDAIYVADWCGNRIHVIKELRLRTSWRITDIPRSISVNTQLNLVITTYGYYGRFLEYTPSDQYVRRVRQQADVRHLFDAIPLEDNRFVLTHGYSDTPLQRVCIINNVGTVLTAFGGTCK